MFRFLQTPLAQFISVVRAPKSKEGYASIGGGSPLRQITDAQARTVYTPVFVSVNINCNRAHDFMSRRKMIGVFICFMITWQNFKGTTINFLLYLLSITMAVTKGNLLICFLFGLI